MTTDPQDRIVNQMEARYHSMVCDPLPDGSLKIVAVRGGSTGAQFNRTVVVDAAGTIQSDDERQVTKR